jgi:hypothetical protein
MGCYTAITSFLASTSTKPKRVRREGPIDNNLPPRCLQHPVGSLLSDNVLRPSFLELATSFRGASRLRQEKSLINRKLFGTAHFLTSTNSF